MNIEPEVVACMNDILDIVVKKEEKRLYQKEYKKKNKEKLKQYYKQYHKEYQQTPKCIKSRRIRDWIRQGIICDNFDALYDHYTKTAYCDFCRVELTYDKNSTATTKCLDHDHSITDRPNFRNILCHSCNIKRK